MELLCIAFWVSNSELVSSHFFFGDKSLLNGSSNQLQVGLLSQVAADTSVIRLFWAVAMTGGIVLGIGLCFHNHAPQQTSIRLSFHQPATHQIRSNDFRRAAEEGFRQGWEIFGDGQGGYGSGLEVGWETLGDHSKIKPSPGVVETRARFTQWWMP